MPIWPHSAPIDIDGVPLVAKSRPLKHHGPPLLISGYTAAYRLQWLRKAQWLLRCNKWKFPTHARIQPGPGLTRPLEPTDPPDALRMEARVRARAGWVQGAPLAVHLVPGPGKVFRQ